MKNPQNSCTIKLQRLMEKVGISSFRQLYQLTGISVRSIDRLRSGNISKLRWQTIVDISYGLKITPIELLEIFSDSSIESPTQDLTTLRQEYQRLQQQLAQQRDILQVEFQYQSLQVLESFLLYFPTAKYAAANNPNFPASKLFPLISSIDQLIAQWNVTVIGEVGAEIPYNPQLHQLIEGIAKPDELVTVRYVGYQQQNKLLFRAKVSR